ncbi:MAG: TAXI family TRAP transporter solute-binding subunit [Burkholderiaceae bacterium]
MLHRPGFLLGLLALIVLLAGCSGGPDEQTLRIDIEKRVAQVVPEQALVLEELERRGTQRDPASPAGESRRIVYYDASLRVKKDVDFGAWDAPGMAGLVSALGAGPKGVSGVRAGGNKAGDIVKVHGTALYKQEDEQWVMVAGAGFRPAQAPSYATSAATGPAAILEAMRKVIDSASRDATPAQMAILEEELTAAHAVIRARLVRARQGYAIAAGPEYGQYLRFARALDEPGGLRMTALVTLGGEENLELLRQEKVQIALAQADSALAAYDGSGAFKARGPARTLRAVGSMFPEAVHVIVRADSGLASVENLRGRSVAVGPLGSASRTTVLRVLEAHGLSLSDVKARDLGLSDALVALRQGKVDAVLQVIGIPADRVRDALTAVPMKLLPLSPRAIAQLSTDDTGLFAFTIPAGSYPGQNRDVRTVATAAVLLVGPDLSDAEVAALTSLVYRKGRDFAARGSAQGLQVSAERARQGLTVPLHLAAERVLSVTEPASPAR